MKRIGYLIALCLPTLINAQIESYKGVKWVEGLSWEQVLAKAKLEGKPIFIDCYTTWCGPCKKMDIQVYSDSLVGEDLNNKFIPVKIQMDKTKHDDSSTRLWYNTVDIINKKFNIKSFPTYLVISPEGTPLHKGVGYKPVNEFIRFSAEALNPQKQYYTLANRYDPSNYTLTELKELAEQYKFSGEEFSWKVAVNYLNRITKENIGDSRNIAFMIDFIDCPEVQKGAINYLENLKISKLSEKNNMLLVSYLLKSTEIQGLGRRYLNSLNFNSQLSKENILFLTLFTKRSSDFGFSILVKYSNKVDSIMGKANYARKQIDNIIWNEEVLNDFELAKNNNQKISWAKIYRSIKRKYGASTAQRVVLSSKSRWFEYVTKTMNKEWDKYLMYQLRYLTNYGYDSTDAFQELLLNRFAWRAIFFHSNQKKQLKKGIEIMEGVVRRNPKATYYIDTYANLLYKAKRKSSALQWENEALRIAIEKNEKISITQLQETIQKMTSGEITWMEHNEKLL